MPVENKRNYQKELERLLKKQEQDGVRPKLLLHACCAPCSSYCLEYLIGYFDITVLFYNPNISPKEEYFHRAAELESLIKRMSASWKDSAASGSEPDRGLDAPENGKKPTVSTGVELVVEDYDEDVFRERVKGLENEPERGKRCTVCYRMRLEKAAEYAASHGFDYFTTTLSISPYKDADRLVSIGEELEKNFGVLYLVSDFKKNNGYKRSIELSEKYGLYRQNYCGCEFSKRNR